MFCTCPERGCGGLAERLMLADWSVVFALCWVTASNLPRWDCFCTVSFSVSQHVMLLDSHYKNCDLAVCKCFLTIRRVVANVGKKQAMSWVILKDKNVFHGETLGFVFFYSVNETDLLGLFQHSMVATCPATNMFAVEVQLGGVTCEARKGYAQQQKVHMENSSLRASFVCCLE